MLFFMSSIVHGEFLSKGKVIFDRGQGLSQKDCFLHNEAFLEVPRVINVFFFS